MSSSSTMICKNCILFIYRQNLTHQTVIEYVRNKPVIKSYFSWTSRGDFFFDTKKCESLFWNQD